MRLRRRWRWILGAMLSLLAGAAITVWLLFQHIPSWYRPAEVAAAEFDRIRTDFTLAGDDLNLAIGRADEPFIFRLTQERLNAWLAAREQIWPLSRNWLGKAVSDPLVLIGEDGVRVAATCRISGMQTILSARFKVTADENRVRVRLLGAEAGSLPVPESLIRRHLARLDETGWPGSEGIHERDGDMPRPMLSSLPDGAEFQNSWTWQMAARPFRIIRVRTENGAIELTIEPLPRQRSRH